MKYTTQSQDNRYLSRRQYRRTLTQQRIESFLSNSEATEYQETLYLSEAKWLRNRYSEKVSFIFPEGTLAPQMLHTCTVRKIIETT